MADLKVRTTAQVKSAVTRSKVDRRFEVRQLSVVVVRVDGGHDSLAPCVRPIGGRVEKSSQRVIGADVPHRRKIRETVARSPLIAERALLVGAAAEIPEIGDIGEPQSVQFA